jgi:rod shape-determining protein MreC
VRRSHPHHFFLFREAHPAVMSVAGHSPPPFFKRGPAPLAQMTFFVIISIVMLMVDLRFQTLEWVRLALATAAWPLQRVAYLPIDASSNVGEYLTRLSVLQTDNEDLRRRLLNSAHLLLRQEHLEIENKRLRALLDMQARQPVKGQIAEILYAARDPFSRKVVIDKGLQHSIASGQAVVDDLGVIGQVTRVFPLTADVSLLTDKDQAIPVQVQRNGLRSVLAGAGAGAMELRFLAANADVQAGDILVTSGLDGIYLPGLPVAKISKIDRDNSFAFARIHCEPLAGVERHGLALVLGNRPPLPATPEAATSAAPGKPGKGRQVKRRPR